MLPSPGSSGAPGAPRPRSLLPPEHGAWGQLALPLASALLIGRPAPAALLLVLAIALAFLAHEPALVALGHRGDRARAADGPRAGRAALRLTLAGGAAGAGGAWLSPPGARAALLLPALLGAALAGLVAARRERTIPGELVVVSALAAASRAVALAGGAPPRAAASIAATWALAFGASVLGVHAVLLRARARDAADPGPPHALAIAALLALGAAAVRAAGLPWAVPLAVAPTAILSLAVCIAPVPPARLRGIGWALVGATTATLALLVAGLRGAG